MDLATNTFNECQFKKNKNNYNYIYKYKTDKNMNFPIYQATLQNSDDGIYTISFVTSPATEVDALYFSKQEDLVFANEEKQMITSVVMICDVPIYRRNGDYEYYITYNKETLTQMAQKMLKDGTFNTLSFEHDGNIIPEGNIELVELYQKDENKKGPFANIKDGSIIATYKVINKDLWDELKQHPLSISLEGLFTLVEVKEEPKQDETEKKYKYSKMLKSKLRELFLKYASEAYTEIVTDKGSIYFEGPELVVGIEVYDENDEPVADGEYTYDEYIVIVEDGKVKEINTTVAPEDNSEEPSEEIQENKNENLEETPEEPTEETPVDEITPLKEEIESLKTELDELKKIVSEYINKPAAEVLDNKYSTVTPEELGDKYAKFAKKFAH